MRTKDRLRQSSINRYENEDAWISDLDPIVDGRFKISYYEPQFYLQIRKNNSQSVPQTTKQNMNLRMLTFTGTEGLAQLKIQLSSEQDLFKLYICTLDAKKFEKIKKTQHLNFTFDQLLPMLIKQINLIQKNNESYSAVLQINQISSNQLRLLESIEYKRIQLLSLEFQSMDEELIKNYATFRFTKTKMNKQILNKKLKDVLSIVKLKNQNLITEIIKKQKLKEQTLKYSK